MYLQVVIAQQCLYIYIGNDAIHLHKEILGNHLLYFYLILEDDQQLEAGYENVVIASEQSDYKLVSVSIELDCSILVVYYVV